MVQFSYVVPLATVPPLTAAEPVIRAIPGVQTVRPGPEPNTYTVEAVNQVGPIRLRLHGVARLSYPDAETVVAAVELNDPVAGSIYGTFRMRRVPEGLALEAEVAIGGRLGEFAQPLLRRKAEETVRGFGENLRRWASRPSGGDQIS